MNEFKEYALLARIVLVLTLISLGVGGIVTIVHFATQPAINRAANEARKTDPLVVNSAQEDLLSKLTQVKADKAKLAGLSGEVKAQLEAVIKSMIAEMKEKAGKLESQDVPPTVAEFLKEN